MEKQAHVGRPTWEVFVPWIITIIIIITNHYYKNYNVYEITFYTKLSYLYNNNLKIIKLLDL